MRTKEYNPDKFIDKLAKLQEEADGVEYSIVMHVGDDADGEPIWSGKNAAKNFRDRVGGRYAIEKRDASSGDAIYIKETTVTDEGQRAAFQARRKSSEPADPSNASSAAMAKAFLGMSEGFSGLVAQASASAREERERADRLQKENQELRGEVLTLTFQLEHKEDDTLETLLPYLDKGLSLFSGHLTRKIITEKLTGELQGRIVDAVGQEAAMKVFMLVAAEFNRNPVIEPVAQEEGEV